MFLKHQGKILAVRGLCHKDIICSFTVGQFCAKVVTLIVPLLQYENTSRLALFLVQNARDMQMTTCVTEGTRREHPHFSRLEASPLARACTPLTKSVEKERLLACSLCLYPNIKCSCRVVKKISDKLTIIIFLVIFAAIPLKLEKVGPIFSRFKPCLSLPSVTTDDREQFQYINMFLNDKRGPSFWNYIDAIKVLAFYRNSK